MNNLLELKDYEIITLCEIFFDKKDIFGDDHGNIISQVRPMINIKKMDNGTRKWTRVTSLSNKILMNIKNEMFELCGMNSWRKHRIPTSKDYYQAFRFLRRQGYEE